MNYGKKHDLPFGIMDVAGLLRLNIRRRAPGQVYVDCPICGDRRGKMNLNTAKDLWRCNYCGEGGGMLSLYAKVYGVSNSDAYREICDALAVNGFSPDYTVPEKTTPAEAEQSDAASDQEVHQTLSMLLSMLTLIPAHHTHLQSVRGLSDDEITRFGFKSTPPPFLCRSLTNRLVKAGCRVQGVPGFYVDDNGCWTVKFHQRTSGIIIPIFGVDGLIRGAQIRLDHPLKDKDDPPEKTGVKYLTLSSTGKRMGTTSGSPIHFVGDPCSRVVYVTEGCLKADVAHALMHRTFVATLGVNNTAKLDGLFAFLHRNGTEEIIEAEDMDKYSNEMVEKGASKIYALAARHGMRCRRLTWNPNYKGIDDWQLALRRKKQKMKEDPGMTFKEQYLNGLCGLEMLEACTEKWHAMKVDSISLGCYPAVSALVKTVHPIPLLSLDKTKSIAELLRFAGEQMVMLMLKLDGLTVKLTYENGLLMEAATRGDGDTGENITHNVLGISGIPDKIPYKERLVVTGEAFIRPSDFEALKDTLRDGNGEPYKNGRNLAAGSVRLLDCGACKDRRVTFMAFNVLEGFTEYAWKSQRLRAIEQLGFPICKYLASKQTLTQFDMDAGIRHLRKYAQENDIPIDGIVVTYNDAAYAKSCGRTGHHYKDGLAFKFEDDTYETVLRSIEWTPSRTGEIAPVAVFDTVEIDGCAVSRASLHNLSFIENLELATGCRIKVSKRNQIIPHVEENLDRDCYARDKVVPARCPCCGQPTRIHTTRNTVNGVEKVTAALFCDNEHCETRKLRKFVHFASPKALNIMGLSEAILEKFIGKGWLHSYMDIFALDKHRAEIVQMEGFGEKSWQNLWDAIQHSRITTFEQYLTAMDIPMVGSTASRAICQRFRGNLAEFETAVCQSFDFTQLPDFGETLHRNIHQWFRSEENWTIWTELRRLVCIKTYQPPAASTDMGNPFVGKTLVVTGKVEPYTRDGINAKIESLGAHAGSSVSSKTDYLICGENAGSKLAKARELGIKILSPDEFFRMAGESA